MHTLLDFASEVLVANVLGPLQNEQSITTASSRSPTARGIASHRLANSSSSPQQGITAVADCSAYRQGMSVPLQQQTAACGAGMAAAAGASRGDARGAAFSALLAGAAAGDSTGGASGHRLSRPPRLTPVWPEDTVADRASTAGSMCSVVVHDSEDEPEVGFPEPPGPSAPPPTPAGQGHGTPAPQKAPSLFQRRQQRAINTQLADGPAGQERHAGVSPLRGLKSLRALITPVNPYVAEHIVAPADKYAAGVESNPAAATGDADGGSSQQGQAAAAAGAEAGSGTPAGGGRRGHGGARPGWVGGAAEALGLSDYYSRQPRVTGGSEESDENSADESTGPLSHSSFRRRPGASVKQLARSVRRAGGARHVWCFGVFQMLMVLVFTLL